MTGRLESRLAKMEETTLGLLHLAVVPSGLSEAELDAWVAEASAVLPKNARLVLIDTGVPRSDADAA